MKTLFYLLAVVALVVSIMAVIVSINFGTYFATVAVFFAILSRIDQAQEHQDESARLKDEQSR